MEHRGYSQARFFLKVDSNNFDIKFFVTRDYRLSKDYQIKVKINTKSILNSGDLIGKESILTIKGKENDTEICGILTQFQGPLSTRGGYDYFLIISSPLTKLKFQKNNKIYLKKTILDLIKEILDKNGYKKYWILTLNEYPLQDAFIQRNQSDYDFIINQLNFFGLFFVFIKDRLIITDDISQMPNNELNTIGFESSESNGIETAYEIKMHNTLLPSSIKLRSYNFDAPEQNLELESQNKQVIGEKYLYAENYNFLEEGEKLLKSRQDFLDCHRQTFKLKTNCPKLIPGLILELKNHPEAFYNRKYKIIESRIYGNQSSSEVLAQGKINKTFENTLTLIPINKKYKPAFKYDPIKGIQTGNIDSIYKKYPYLDNYKYYIKPHFEFRTFPKCQASSSIRLMQLFSGKNYGMHFPIHSGQELLYMVFEKQIIILGTVPNRENLSVTTSKNISQNILKTLKNTMIMEDKINENKIILKNKGNTITLNNHKKENKVELLNKENDINIELAKFFLQKSKKNITEFNRDNVINTKNLYKIETKKEDMKSSVKKRINFKIQEKLKFESRKDTFFKSNESININSENISINEKKDVFLSSQEVIFKGKRNIKIRNKKGNIIIRQGKSLIKISARGNISIKAKKININMSNNLDGQSILLFN